MHSGLWFEDPFFKTSKRRCVHWSSQHRSPMPIGFSRLMPMAARVLKAIPEDVLPLPASVEGSPLRCSPLQPLPLSPPPSLLQAPRHARQRRRARAAWQYGKGQAATAQDRHLGWIAAHLLGACTARWKLAHQRLSRTLPASAVRWRTGLSPCFECTGRGFAQQTWALVWLTLEAPALSSWRSLPGKARQPRCCE